MITPELASSEEQVAGAWARARATARAAWRSLRDDETLALALAKLRFIGRVRARPAVARREVELHLDALLRRLDLRPRP